MTSTIEDTHKKFMRECLKLARKGKGNVSPNPLVGAVLVKGGRIVARGFHARFGGPHAEVECLGSFRGSLRHSTLYVNLEPCSHYGKTPPCADLIIRSGIRRVVVGMKDPNPLVAGKGIRKLRAAGVRVETGILEEEARDLNRVFVSHITKRRPYVHMKIAQTLDGKIALRNQPPISITGKEAQKLVHRWRAEHDAVLVGAGTIRADNPSLTVRYAQGRNPAAVILDGRLSVDPQSKVFDGRSNRRVILFTRRAARIRYPRRYQQIASRGAMLLSVESKDNALSISSVLSKLYDLNIGSVLVEGGNRVFTHFLSKGLVDRMSIFIAPRLFNDSGLPTFAGGYLNKTLSARVSSAEFTVEKIGGDVLLDFMFGE